MTEEEVANFVLLKELGAAERNMGNEDSAQKKQRVEDTTTKRQRRVKEKQVDLDEEVLVDTEDEEDDNYLQSKKRKARLSSKKSASTQSQKSSKKKKRSKVTKNDSDNDEFELDSESDHDDDDDESFVVDDVESEEIAMDINNDDDDTSDDEYIGKSQQKKKAKTMTASTTTAKKNKSSGTAVKKSAATKPPKTTTTKKKRSGEHMTFEQLKSEKAKDIDLKKYNNPQAFPDNGPFVEPVGIDATGGIVESIIGGMVQKVGKLLLLVASTNTLEERERGELDFPIKLNTACSGTDAPSIALGLVKECLDRVVLSSTTSTEEKGGVGHGFDYEHNMSCELEPFKQAYINRNFPDVLLFPDITKLTGGESVTDVYGREQRIPESEFVGLDYMCV